MSNFSVSDSFYRFNCKSDVSPVGDTSFVEKHEKSKLFILPYAPYSYCSEMLKSAYSLLDKTLHTIIVLIPTYNYCSDKLMTFTSDRLMQIDRSIKVDFELLKQFSENYSVYSEDFEFEFEEIFKTHLDFLLANSPDVKIVPLFYNDIVPDIVSEILTQNWGVCSFLILSNLSCGFGYNDACRLDNFTAKNIETNRIMDVSYESFSAFKILPEILKFSKSRNYSFVRLGLVNSGEFNNDLASTRGYGAWMLYEKNICEYLKKYYSRDILDFIKFNLQNELHVGCGACFNLPEVFNQEIKVFVSFERDGFVRGVSGSFRTPEPLFKALVKRTFGAAFSDIRFAPIKPDELENLKINVVLICDDLMSSILIN